MNHNFDELIERKNTNSIKYDFAKERGKPEDILPLWVADMDFQTPICVRDALINSTQHGIFGYSDVKESYVETLQKWFSEKFDFQIESSWLVKTPGVVFAICQAINAFTEVGDAVMIQRPVYYPFFESIEKNGRNVVNNALVYENGKYEIDFLDFEEKIIKNHVKLFILCNPHNPVGRVWTKEELIKMGDICLKHGVLVVSDEIHADFVREGFIHSVFTNLKKEFLDISIICTAPSKTFNLAGLQVSNIFIPNEGLRSKFKKEITKTGYSQLNTLGLVACQAAYEMGTPWLVALKQYLEENLIYVRNFLVENLPQLKLIEPEGTYLLWVDFKSLGLEDKELDHLIVNKGKLWFDTGTMFGVEGSGFQRINIACPREILKEALQRLQRIIE